VRNWVKGEMLEF